MVHAYIDAVTPRTLNPVVTHQGGIAHAVDCWTRLRRFLILGAEGGSFYVNARDLTIENVACVRKCLDADAFRAIGEIQTISESGRAPKNEPAILALALASLHPNEHVRAQAFDAMPYVCRTGTHLLHFVKCRCALNGNKKFGRMMRRAIGDWFTSKSARDLAYQAVKYPSRDGWALRDLLRLSRMTKGVDHEMSFVIGYIVRGWPEKFLGLDAFESARFLNACRLAHESNDNFYIASLIHDWRIPREALPTHLLNDPLIWDALLADMPLTAMIRNLGKMSSVGLLTRGSDAERTVVDALGDAERLCKARVHPLSLLVALKVYEQGHGEKGSLTWTPSKRVVSALDEAFYLAFGAVESTGKRICLSLDVSASMAWSTIAGMPLTPRDAAAAMALVTAATEPKSEIVAFSSTMVPLPIRPSMRLDEVVRVISRVPAGGTYPELPMAWARGARQVFDLFVTYTDNETGSPRAVWDELRAYRSAVNKSARHAVVGMVSNGFSIADPDDPGQLDVVGFDTATPQVLAEFALGRV